MSIGDLTLYYRLTADIPGHTTGEVLPLCEQHVTEYFHQTILALGVPIPAPGSCWLCAEERYGTVFPLEMETSEDDQQAEDEHNYCTMIQDSLDRASR